MRPVERYLSDLNTVIGAVKRHLTSRFNPTTPTAALNPRPPMTQITFTAPLFTRVGSEIELTGPATVKNLDADGNPQSSEQSNHCQVTIKFDSELKSLTAMETISTSPELRAHVILYDGVFDNLFMTTGDGVTLSTHEFEF